MTEGRISELEAMSIEFSKSEKQREQKQKKIIFQDYATKCNIQIMEFKRKRKRGGDRKIFGSVII